jgi:hypothetical protein
MAEGPAMYRTLGKAFSTTWKTVDREVLLPEENRLFSATTALGIGVGSIARIFVSIYQDPI